MKVPSYVSNKPEALKKKWIKIFNDIKEEHGPQVALVVANNWLMRQPKREEVSRTEKQIIRIPLELDTTRELITRTDNGDEYVSFKLADVFKDAEGLALPAKVLKKWAAMINAGEVFVGDIDHQHMNEMSKIPMSDEDFDYSIKHKQGIAKTVRAVFEKGKLWVRALIDKRYKKQIEKSKGVSMEAVILRDERNQVVDASLLGFTFGIKDTPIIKGTEVYMNAAA